MSHPIATVNDEGQPVPPISPNSPAVYFLGVASPNKKTNNEKNFSYPTDAIDRTADKYTQRFIAEGKYSPMLFDHADNLKAGQIIMAYRNANDDMCIFGRLTNETPGGRRGIHGVATQTIAGLSGGLGHARENTYIADLDIDLEHTVGHELREVSITPNPCYSGTTWIKYCANNPGDILEAISRLSNPANSASYDPNVAIKRLPASLSALPQIMAEKKGQGMRFRHPKEPPASSFNTAANVGPGNRFYQLPGGQNDPTSLNMLRSFFSHVEHVGAGGAGKKGGPDLDQFFVPDTRVRKHPTLPNTYISSYAIRTNHSEDGVVWFVDSEEKEEQQQQIQTVAGMSDPALLPSATGNGAAPPQGESADDLKKKIEVMQKQLEEVTKRHEMAKDPLKDVRSMVNAGLGAAIAGPGFAFDQMSEGGLQFMTDAEHRALEQSAAQGAAAQATQSTKVAQSLALERAKYTAQFLQSVPETRTDSALLERLVTQTMAPFVALHNASNVKPPTAPSPSPAPVPPSNNNAPGSAAPPTSGTGPAAPPAGPSATMTQASGPTTPAAPANSDGEPVTPSTGSPVPVNAGPMSQSKSGIQVPITPDTAGILDAAKGTTPGPSAFSGAFQEILKDPNAAQLILTQFRYNQKNGIDSTEKWYKAQAQAAVDQQVSELYKKDKELEAQRIAETAKNNEILKGNEQILKIGDGLIEPVKDRLAKSADPEVVKFLQEFRSAKTDPKIVLNHTHLLKLTDFTTKASAEIASQSQAERMVNQKLALKLQTASQVKSAEAEIQRIKREQLSKLNITDPSSSGVQSQQPAATTPGANGGAGAKTPASPSPAETPASGSSGPQSNMSGNGGQVSTNANAGGGGGGFGSDFSDELLSNFYANAEEFYGHQNLTGNYNSYSKQTIWEDPDTYAANQAPQVAMNQAYMAERLGTAGPQSWPYTSERLMMSTRASASAGDVQNQFSQQVFGGSGSKPKGQAGEVYHDATEPEPVLTTEVYNKIVTRASAGLGPTSASTEQTQAEKFKGNVVRFMNLVTNPNVDFVKMGVDSVVASLSLPGKRAWIRPEGSPCGGLFDAAKMGEALYSRIKYN